MAAGSCQTAVDQLSTMWHAAQSGWANAPLDVLERIGGLLTPDAVAAGRLTCSAWRTGLSAGVTSLRSSFAARHGCAMLLGGLTASPLRCETGHQLHPLHLPTVVTAPIPITTASPSAGLHSSPCAAGRLLLGVAYQAERPFLTG